MNTPPEKILILDGIGGVPLGREICDTFTALGSQALHFDCLQQQRRPLYTLRSVYAKAQNRRAERDGFCFLPKLIEKELQALIAQERPSHILVVGFAYKFYDPLFLRRMADQFQAGLFLYDTDSCNLYPRRREFIFFIENELPIYDRIFSFSQVTTRFFRDTRGLNVSHLPYGALPLHCAAANPSVDALFVGSGDLRRIFLLEAIREQVTVRGNRWQRNYPLISEVLRSRIVDRPVWGEDLHRLLGSAKIVLNITRTDFFGVETGVNLRIFEALAGGSFLLTDHCDEIADLFKVGEEIETYRSSGELAEKVTYYLKHDDQRRAIAEKGHAAFLQKHTWQARIEQQMLPLLQCG
jgi:spore maturation protein CgeB